MYWTILEWASLSGPLTLVSHSTLFHWTCHFILSLYSCTICISTGPNLLSLSSRSSISCCRSADVTLSRTRVSIDANASTLSLTFLLCCVTLEMKSVKRELRKQIFFNHHGLNWVTVKDSHGKKSQIYCMPNANPALSSSASSPLFVEVTSGCTWISPKIPLIHQTLLWPVLQLLL